MIVGRAVAALARCALAVSQAGLLVLGLAIPSASRAELPTALANADGWAAQPPSRERDRILERWALQASLPDLMYVLRRESREFGPVEAILVQRALDQTPAERTALRTRLAARLAPYDARKVKKRIGSILDALPRLKPGEGASAFRVGLLIPSGESYADFARALRAGLETGLEPAGPALPAEIAIWSTGEDDPGRVGAALDSAARRCGVAVGELLSAPTLVLAAGARVWGMPLVSPTATDETIGQVGPAVYQIGPSGYERGQRLARAVPLAGRRIGVLTSNGLATPFARGFAETAEGSGAQIVMKASYAAATTFRTEVKELVAKKVDVLFWDGEPAEVATLLKLLAHSGATMRICGGQPLAPEQHHKETHFLLEGVQYVGDEWVLPAALRDTLERASMERTGEPVGPLFVRGWLAGKAIRGALDAGALCPEEIIAELERRRMRGRFLEAHGFLTAGVPGMNLPIFTVSRGKAIAANN